MVSPDDFIKQLKAVRERAERVYTGAASEPKDYQKNKLRSAASAAPLFALNYCAASVMSNEILNSPGISWAGHRLLATNSTNPSPVWQDNFQEMHERRDVWLGLDIKKTLIL
jgi:hypothetical protein